MWCKLSIIYKRISDFFWQKKVLNVVSATVAYYVFIQVFVIEEIVTFQIKVSEIED